MIVSTVEDKTLKYFVYSSATLNVLIFDRRTTMLPQQTSSEFQVTVKIPCHVSWKLLQEYDNSENHNTTINRTVSVMQFKEVKGTDYTKTINESSREEAYK